MRSPTITISDCMNIKGELPLPEYLARFVRWRFNLNKKDYFDIDRNSAIGHLIKAVILMQQVPGYDCNPDESDEKYDGLLIFTTADPNITLEMVSLPNTVITSVVRMLLFWMYETTLKEVKRRAATGIPATHTLWLILIDEAEMENFLSWDAFEKGYKRHRKRKETAPTPAKVFNHLLFKKHETELF